MFWINVKRVIRSGFFNFWRNGFVSLSSILMMIVTLSVVGSVIFLGTILNSSLQAIRNKVDFNVYFVTTAAEDDILAMQKSIEALPEVQTVTYTSRDKALADFKLRHQTDQFTLQALDELSDNPLGATLNVKAKDPSQYEGIANFLKDKGQTGPGGTSIIDKINYYQNKEAIDKLSSIINSANRLGLILTLVLVLISVLITVNTIRLAIYMSREEISVMRLVGASGTYIRGPFMVSGMLYGLISGLITIAMFYPVTFWLGNVTQNFFIGLNVFTYYTENFGQIFLIIVGSGIFIGAISSFAAVKKYITE